MMVQVQTEGVNTFGGFLKELQQMLNNLVDAHNKHTAIHKKMMAQCMEEFNFRKKEIADAKLAFGRAMASRTRCQASLNGALKTLPVLRNSLRTYKNELKRATAQREAEKKKYLERRQAFGEALAFLEQFIAFVTKSFKGKYKAFSFTEMSESLLKHSSKLNLMAEAVPVLVELAQRGHDYSYKYNQDLGARLKQALNDLLTRIRNDSKTNDADENKAVAIFNKYKARLDAVIDTLRKNIKRVKQQIVDMTRCIETEGKIIASASAKLSRNGNLLKHADNMCKAFNKEFIEATYNRLDEIKTMHEILKIVARRFKKLPRDLITYLETVKNGWKKYINSTEFRKFVEYQRKVYAVNVRGKHLGSVDADKEKNY
jgi:transposase